MVRASKKDNKKGARINICSGQINSYVSNKQQNDETIKDQRLCDASHSSVMILNFTLFITNDAQSTWWWQKRKAEEKIKLRNKIEHRIRAFRLYFAQDTLTRMNCIILFVIHGQTYLIQFMILCLYTVVWAI